MTSLYEFLCYQSLEQLDKIMGEFHTFIHTTPSFPQPVSATSSILLETIDDNFYVS